MINVVGTAAVVTVAIVVDAAGVSVSVSVVVAAAVADDAVLIVDIVTKHCPNFSITTKFDISTILVPVNLVALGYTTQVGLRYGTNSPKRAVC